VKKFWCAFFIFWPIVAVLVCWLAPQWQWWFPQNNRPAQTPLGGQIDDLFYLILVIVAVVFILTQAALGYALWRGAQKTDTPEKAFFTHGSHNLEVVWTIVPAGILLFIALYQMDVWAQYRVQTNFPRQAVLNPIAEVEARQFEWRIRYPAPGRKFKDQADVERWLRNPEPGDLYMVNDLHVPTGRPVLIHLRSGDVQHSFFVPVLRVKQDAVPGLVIPVWFEVLEPGPYELTCAELCGWGHYKMKARVMAQPDTEFRQYLEQLQREQTEDGFDETAAPAAGGQ
jgi:cytochrome c oxidase subunit II